MKTAKRTLRPVPLILWGLLAVILIGIAILLATHRRPEQTATTEIRPVPVRTLLLASRRMVDTIRIPGRIEANVAADLAVEKGGRIVSLQADKGDRVKAGQVLLQLDGRLWAAQLKRAATELQDAERELARWEALRKTGAVSDSDFDTVQRRVELARIAVDEGQTHVSQCEVRSPVDGWVNSRYVEVGEFVAEGKPVFTVIEIDTVKVSMDVPERDITAVATGDRIAFGVSILPGQTFTGAVSFVSAQADRASNSFRLEMTLPNPGWRLKPGMLADVSLVRGTRESAIVVPLEAVVPQRGEHVIFVVQDGRAVRRVVKIDGMAGHEALLSAGAEAGEAVVIEGYRSLVDGIPVSVME